MKRKTLPVIGVVVLGFIFYYYKLLAYTLVDVSVAFPIVRIGPVFTVIGGYFFLHERDNLAQKLISLLLILSGVVLLSGYYQFWNWM